MSVAETAPVGSDSEVRKSHIYGMVRRRGAHV